MERKVYCNQDEHQDEHKSRGVNLSLASLLFFSIEILSASVIVDGEW